MKKYDKREYKINECIGVLIFVFVLLRTYLLAIFPYSALLLYLLPLTLILVIFKISSDVRLYGLSRNKVFYILFLFTMVLTFFTRDFRPLSNLLIVFSLRTWEFKKVMRYFFWTALLIFFGIVFMGMVGITPNHVWFDGIRHRRFIGFANPNTGMQMTLLIWTSYLYLNWTNLFKKVSILKTALIGAVFPMVIWYLTQSRMPLIAFLAGTFVLLAYRTKLPQISNPVLKWIFALIPLFLSILSMVMALVFGSHQFLNNLLSTRPYLWSQMLNQVQYPVNLVGYHFNILENLYCDSGICIPLILDNSYLYLLTVRGVLMFVVFLFLFSYLLYKETADNCGQNVFILITLMVYGFGENIFISIGTNVLFFMLYSASKNLTDILFKKDAKRYTECRTKKILYVITRAEWGGAQVHLFDVLTEVTKCGYECEVAIGEKGKLYDRLVDIGIKVYYLKNLVHEIEPISDLKAVFELNKVIKLSDPDMVHLHSTKAGWIGRISTLCMGKKVIFTVHGWCFTEGAPKSRKKIGEVIEKFLVPMTDEIICVSEYDKNLAISQGVATENELTVVYNGVAQIPNLANAKINVQDSDSFKVMMTARFADPKDQETVIRAFQEVQDDIELYFVGDGPNLDSCKKLTEKLNLSHRVHFLGQRGDVAVLLKSMDIFVLSSYYEGLPISIIEAMSASLPIIASDVGGVKELVYDGKNGYLFQTGNVSDLVLKLKLLDKAKALQLGKESFRLYKENFTLEKCVLSTLAVYERVFQEGVRS